jgi:tetrahydrodipicolinate N-succinyltransferase
MKNISLRIDDEIFEDTEKMITQLHKARNRYINEALEFYNQYQKRALLAKKLKSESELVRENSMEMVKEFDQLEDDN